MTFFMNKCKLVTDSICKKITFPEHIDLFDIVSACCLNLFWYLQPRVVSDIDEIELEKQLKQLEDENREVAGDSDEEDDVEGMGEIDGEEPGEEEEGEDWGVDLTVFHICCWTHGQTNSLQSMDDFKIKTFWRELL